MTFAGKLAVTVFLAGVLDPFGGQAYRLTEEGNRRYSEKAYEEALRDYTEAQVQLPEAPELFYDIGNVLFRQGDLAGAEEAWTRALNGAEGDLLADISHNLGNARYQRQAFQEAVDAYSQALSARPEDRDTKRNLELALRQLQAQQQQQQDQEKKDGDQAEKSEDQDSGRQDQGKRDPQQGKQAGGQANPGDKDPDQQPAGEGMTREEAERLLDSLEAQEKDNLKKEEEARKRARAGDSREKDW